jgi:hypothetical protein
MNLCNIMVSPTFLKAFASVARPAVSKYIARSSAIAAKRASKRKFTPKETEAVERMVRNETVRPSRVSMSIKNKVMRESDILDKNLGLTNTSPMTRSAPGALPYIKNELNPNWAPGLRIESLSNRRKKIDNILRANDIYTNKYSNPERYTGLGVGVAGLGGLGYAESRKKRPYKRPPKI